MAQAADLPISLADVQAAAEAIRELVHRTPVLTSSSIDQLAGRQLWFKCETLQKTGAFKYRGACNAVRQLSAEQRAKGVVTHSSGEVQAACTLARAARSDRIQCCTGNHAAALALAATSQGIAAQIVSAADCRMR